MSLHLAHAQTAAETESVARLFQTARGMWNKTSTTVTGRNMALSYAVYLDVVNKEPVLDTPYLSDALFELSELVEEAQRKIPASFATALSRLSPQVGSVLDPLDLLQASAELGHPDAQHKLGTVYSTGVSPLGLVPVDFGRSLFLEYMSALSGNPEANMVLGFRHLFGIGVPENCQKAVLHYEYAANYAVNQINLRGYPLYIEKSKLVDVDREALGRKPRDSDPELLDYYRHLADEGDVYASLALGNMYMSGSRLNKQDYTSAAKYLKIAADGGNAAASGQLGYILAQGLGGNVGQNIPNDKVVEYVRFGANRGDVTGLLGLGYVYLLGIGVEKNETKAKDLFSKVASKSADASFYLAEMIMGEVGSAPTSPYSHSSANPGGRGASRVSQQPTAAAATPAPGTADFAQAAKCYAVAAQRGHVFSLHRLAHMSKTGLGVSAQCATAASGFKAVAERGDWAADLSLAHRHYDRGDKEEALLLFSKLAAMGMEMAQYNAAYLLARGVGPANVARRKASSKHPGGETAPAAAAAVSSSLEGYSGPLPGPVIKRLTSNRVANTEPSSSSRESAAFVIAEKAQWEEILHPRIVASQPLWGKKSGEGQRRTETTAAVHRRACEQRALNFYSLSAGQGVAESYLRIGDFYYYGLGGLHRDKPEAAFYYQIAADLRHTHAMFNLGIMHELGDGVVQDLHLSKRFYDQAAEFDSEARLPRSVALALLQGHRFVYSTLGQETVDHWLRVLLPTAADWLGDVARWVGEGLALLPRDALEKWVPSSLPSPLPSSDPAFDGVQGGAGSSLGSGAGGGARGGEKRHEDVLEQARGLLVRAGDEAVKVFLFGQTALLSIYSVLLHAFVKLLRLAVRIGGRFDALSPPSTSEAAGSPASDAAPATTTTTTSSSAAPPAASSPSTGLAEASLDITRAEEELFDLYLILLLGTALLYLSVWRSRRRRHRARRNPNRHNP